MREYGKTYVVEGLRARILHWVSLAASDNDTMLGMYKRIRSENGLLISTDGVRLHIAEARNLGRDNDRSPWIEDGDYRILSSRKTMVTIGKIGHDEIKATGEFPNWRKVVPDGIPSKTCEMSGNISIAHGQLMHKFGLDACINVKFMEDIGVAHSWWMAHWYEPEGGVPKPIVFTYNEMKAVIAPMRKDEITD